MMSNSTIDELDSLFLECGFSRKNRIWYKYLDEAIVISEVQKFRFDNNFFFLNFGIQYSKENKSKNKPKGESSWDLRGRYGSISKSKADDMFPMHFNTYQEQEKLLSIKSNIKEVVLPFLYHYAILENLVNDLRGNQFDHARALTSVDY